MRTQGQQSPESRFDALLTAAVDAIILIDTAGAVTAFNPAATRVFGYKADEVIGRNVSMLMPELYRGGHDGYIRRYRETGDARIIGIGREVTALRKDGTTFPIDLAVGEIADGSGFVGIIRDISERKRVQEQLRQREEQLGLVLDNAPLGTATYDSTGRILSVNQAFCRMLGYQPGELLGKSFRDLTHPEDVEAAARRIRRAFDGGLSAYRLEKRYLRKDGSVMHGMLHAGVVHDADDRPVFLVAQVEDRTRQRTAEEEMRQQRERFAHLGRISTIGEMAAGLAHEINQPLAAITNYARACRNMVSGGVVDPTELAGTLDKIAAQAQRAADVIERLRGMVRKRDSEFGKSDLNELVREVIALADGDARANGIRLQLELTPALPGVVVDPVQVQQVVLNLVRNAIDAMTVDGAPDGRPVITICTSCDDEVRLSVADTGSGVAGDAIGSLFTPFFTTKPGGLGLGLSISANIIEAHGGEMGHAPNNPAGTVFWFTLPPHDE